MKFPDRPPHMILPLPSLHEVGESSRGFIICISVSFILGMIFIGSLILTYGWPK